jgi:hypothetical protein
LGSNLKGVLPKSGNQKGSELIIDTSEFPKTDNVDSEL